MTTQELFEQMQGLWNEFSVEHSKTTKAAHGRARKMVSDLKKLVTESRKASLMHLRICTRCAGCGGATASAVSQQSRSFSLNNS